MGFIKFGPQLVRHTSGYSVESKERFALSYKDSAGEVTIYREGGPTGSALYPNSMKRLSEDGQSRDVTPEERALIFPRILAGFKAMYSLPVEIMD